jgi:hypothetical protein
VWACWATPARLSEAHTQHSTYVSPSPRDCGGVVGGWGGVAGGSTGLLGPTAAFGAASIGHQKVHGRTSRTWARGLCTSLPAQSSPCRRHLAVSAPLHSLYLCWVEGGVLRSAAQRGSACACICALLWRPFLTHTASGAGVGLVSACIIECCSIALYQKQVVAVVCFVMCCLCFDSKSLGLLFVSSFVVARLLIELPSKS